MKYHALFMVNHTPYGLVVETTEKAPHPAVVHRAVLAVQITDYNKIRVLQDRGDFFGHGKTKTVYKESQLLKWIARGCSVFDWPKLLLHVPLPDAPHVRDA